MPRLDFWYDFASTYSYIAAMRIGPAAAERGVAVTWRPFLLGPIFAAQGWTDSPFNIYEAKGRYMWRDMARLAADHGLAFTRPASFPQRSLLAARIALAGVRDGWIGPFTRAVYAAEFGEGRDIGDEAVLAEILAGLGLDAPALIARAGSDEIKQALRASTDAAIAAGVFGAPSFTAPDGELFWGSDRLDAALAWAAATRA